MRVVILKIITIERKSVNRQSTVRYIIFGLRNRSTGT